MFGLIRRISYSVIPRPDRPWEDDPTSNAPNTRRKRRLSSPERVSDVDDEQARKKKLRGESDEADLGSGDTTAAAEGAGQEDGEELVTVRREGSLEVKDVTKGVKEVELEDKDSGAAVDAPTELTNTEDDKEAVEANEPGHDAVTKPESIPLPEEEAGELDEPRSSSPLQADPEPQPQLDPPPADSNQPADLAPSHSAETTRSSASDHGENDYAASPDRPGRASTRKTRSSPKKVAKTKA